MLGVLLIWGMCGILILLVAGILFWSAALPKIKRKKLAFVMLSLGFNVVLTPLSIFIGIMATASPTSTTKDFWAGFFIAQAMPLLMLLLVILKWLIIDRRKNN